MAITYGNVKHPPFEDRLIPSSENGAWDDLGQRKALGVCQHSMVGTLTGTDKWFRFNPVTGRWPTGLTDYGIGGSTDGSLDGVIYRWNDPLGRRAGWANGGSDGLEGDGPAFVRTLGVNAINRDLVSIERSDGGNINNPMSPKQFEGICQLTAYWFDQAKVPYTSFPTNPAVGIVTHMIHKEFATKDCPFPSVYNKITEIQDRVRVILKAAQETATPTPVPEWPNGWTTAQLTKQFGKVTEIQVDPKTNVVTSAIFRGFSKTGVLSNMWVSRAIAEGITDVTKIPKPSHFTVTRDSDGGGVSVFVVPRVGAKDWIGFRGDGNASWIWVD